MDTKKLRQKILDLAIRGKLVPQDPNDEPASVLLERIREEKKRLVKEGKLKKNDLEETLISEDEKPFDIPESWKWVRLGEISTYANTKKKINAAQADSNLWGLDLEDIEKGGRLLCLKSVGERKAIGDKTCFSEGDILYSKLRPYLLKILIAPRDGICTPEIIPFTCYGCICKEFIVSLLKSAYVDDYINSVTFGVKMPRVSTETMVSLVIPLPPLSEQKRIANAVERWFTLIDELESNEGDLLKAIDKAKSKILDLAIHGKLVPQDSNDEPAIDLLKRIYPKFEVCDLEECPFAIPHSWCWTIFSSVCELITGSTPSKAHSEYYGGEFPFYKPSDLDAGRHVTVPSEYLSDKGKEVSRIIPEKSTAICCIGSIGKCGYIEREGTTNQQINTAVPMRCLYSLYLYYYCNSKSFVDTLTEGSSAITISIVNKSKLGKMPISLPPLAEQKRIVAKIEELFSVLDSIKESLEA